jgi:hypothetical protein
VFAFFYERHACGRNDRLDCHGGESGARYGVLNMLHDQGYEELGRLHDLVRSCDAGVLENVPDDIHKLAE